MCVCVSICTYKNPMCFRDYNYIIIYELNIMVNTAVIRYIILCTLNYNCKNVYMYTYNV